MSNELSCWENFNLLCCGWFMQDNEQQQQAVENQPQPIRIQHSSTYNRERRNRRKSDEVVVRKRSSSFDVKIKKKKKRNSIDILSSEPLPGDVGAGAHRRKQKKNITRPIRTRLRSSSMDSPSKKPKLKVVVKPKPNPKPKPKRKVVTKTRMRSSSFDSPMKKKEIDISGIIVESKKKTVRGNVMDKWVIEDVKDWIDTLFKGRNFGNRFVKNDINGKILSKVIRDPLNEGLLKDLLGEMGINSIGVRMTIEEKGREILQNENEKSKPKQSMQESGKESAPELQNEVVYEDLAY